MKPVRLALAVGLLLAAPAAAKTLKVGPGQPYARPCLAIAAAAAGDVIEIDAAGSYQGDTCAWSTDNLTVRGVNGRPRLDITGTTPAQQKGLFTISAPNATIENLELSGAAISAAAGNNGAGIRHQGLNLTVRGCYFHDNQNGILGAPSAAGQGEVIIERSEFARNGAGDGYSHNIYLGNYARFTLQGSYSHDARVGHLVKVRAKESRILSNRLTDEGGSASYELNLPNAGTAYVIGNLFEQSAATQNPTLLAYGEEGVPAGWDTHLHVVNNTFLNRRKSGTFVANKTATPALLSNNIFWSSGGITATVAASATDIQTANFTSAEGDPRFMDVARYDVHLQAGSPCIDKGWIQNMPALQAAFEYVHPLGLAARVASGPVDIGAYEHRDPASPADGAVLQDGGATRQDGGADLAPGRGAGEGEGEGAATGCSASGPPGAGAGWGAALLLALLALARALSRGRRLAPALAAAPRRGGAGPHRPPPDRSRPRRG
jgi:hypothetical protein